MGPTHILLWPTSSRRNPEILMDVFIVGQSKNYGGWNLGLAFLDLGDKIDTSDVKWTLLEQNMKATPIFPVVASSK